MKFVGHVFLQLSILVLGLAIISTNATQINLSTKVYDLCDENKYTTGGAFNTTLARAFNMLQKSSAKSLYGSARVGPRGIKVNSMYQCRGDISHAQCAQCVNNAIQSVRAACPNAIGGRVQLDGCYVRYEKYDFFYLDTIIEAERCTYEEANSTVYQHNVQGLINDLIAKAPKKGANGGFAKKVVTTSDGEYKLYGLAQCLGFLSGKECTKCLKGQDYLWVQTCSGASLGSQIHSAGCYYRFETSRFFY